MPEPALYKTSSQAKVSIQLDRALFRYLQLMDREAGACGGLEDYGRLRHPEMPRHEVEWGRRLAELLRDDGVLAKVGELYPAIPKARCDLRLTLPNGARIWLEIRGAWKSGSGQNASRAYRSRLLYPLVPDLPSRISTAALDVRRLASLTERDADGAAFLLLGFDGRAHPMSADVDLFESLSGLDAWACARASWSQCVKTDRFVRGWLWIRDLKATRP